MKTRYYAKTKEIPKMEAGAILIAQPFWLEEMYQRVVILILEHNSSGTTGILLNKKSNLMIVEALPSLNILKPLYYGGAFDTKVISYLHSNEHIPESIYLGNNLYWGGNFEAVSDMVEQKLFNLDEINFFAGFVHWDVGQLEDEINNSKWWVCEMSSKELFSVPPEDLWAESLDICENLYSLFGNIPDPSFN